MLYRDRSTVLTSLGFMALYVVISTVLCDTGDYIQALPMLEECPATEIQSKHLWGREECTGHTRVFVLIFRDFTFTCV